MRRRKITREMKPVLPEEEVNRQLKMCQDKIREGRYLPSQICNIEETGINYGSTNTYSYIPIDASRGTQDLKSDLKARITSLSRAYADGSFLPNHFIIKHSISSKKVLIKLQ
jgi:hypothetical protein